MTAMLSRRQIFFAASFLFAQALSAATIINGGNLANQTWTAAGTPYIVMGDATIVAVTTLEIGPGVEVRFASVDAVAAGRDPSRVELTINGSLTVNGTAASPVIFKGQTASAGLVCPISRRLQCVGDAADIVSSCASILLKKIPWPKID